MSVTSDTTIQTQHGRPSSVLHFFVCRCEINFCIHAQILAKGFNHIFACHIAATMPLLQSANGDAELILLGKTGSYKRHPFFTVFTRLWRSGFMRGCMNLMNNNKREGVREWDIDC